MLILTDYWTGPGRERRDIKYAKDLTPEIIANAKILLPRVNLLLARMTADGVKIVSDPQTNSPSHSGWRPPTVNAATKGAAKKSNHMVGQADDLYDPKNELDAWCMTHLDVLAKIGLWLEHPDGTPGWCHVQSVPPGSGNRVYRTK